jgi:hypothetical protein
MTIMNKLVTFNLPVKEIDCCQCRGKGKIKTNKTPGSTMLFCGFVGMVLLFSFMTLVGTSPRYWLTLPLFLISATVSILLLKEYKEQKLEEVARK